MVDNPRLTYVSALMLSAAALLACKKQEEAPANPAASPDTPAAPGTAAAPRAASGAATLQGSYKIVSASNPGGGGGYTGTVTIAKQGELYSVGWNLLNNPPYKGVGLVSGDLLGVGWGLGSAYGVAVYTVAGGTLTGKWATSATKEKAGTETLTGPEGLNGTYKITAAKGPDGGAAYTGTATIKPTGAVYSVTWNLPADSYSGVGILEGNVFSVGWGVAGAGAGAVAYRLGDKLDGKWAQPQGTQIGTEVLSKAE